MFRRKSPDTMQAGHDIRTTIALVTTLSRKESLRSSPKYTKISLGMLNKPSLTGIKMEDKIMTELQTQN